MSEQQHRRALGEIHLAVLLFGLAGLFGKWVSLPATWIVLGRTLFASLFLIIFMRLRGESPRAGDFRSKGVLTLTGMILAFHWVAFFQAIQLSTVAIGLLTFSAFPVFTLFLEPVFGQGKPGLRSLFQALLTVIGVCLVVNPFGEMPHGVLWGSIWGLASGLSFAFLALFNRSLGKQHPPRRIALWQDGVAAICLLPVIGVSPQNPSALDISLLLLLGVVFTGISHTLFISGLRTIPARTASLIASLEPLYGTLAAFLFLKEKPSPMVLLGGGIIIGVTVWASLPKKAGM